MSLSDLARRFKYSNMWGLRPIINQLYYDENKVNIDNRLFDYIVISGCKFPISTQLESVMKIQDNPWFYNLKSDDIVLDIGANIGAIALPAAMIAKKVWAVEPLYGDELRAGIKLNGFNNVNVIDYALGKDHTTVKLAFSEKEAFCECVSFAKLLEITGEVTWIKIDCEGAEWALEPVWLTDIPEIRIEFHILRGRRAECEQKLNEWHRWLKNNKYKVIEEHGEYLKHHPSIIYCFSINASLGKGKK